MDTKEKWIEDFDNNFTVIYMDNDTTLYVAKKMKLSEFISSEIKRAREEQLEEAINEVKKVPEVAIFANKKVVYLDEVLDSLSKLEREDI